MVLKNVKSSFLKFDKKVKIKFLGFFRVFETH